MLTAAGVTCSASAAAAKLRRVATASNTRSAFSGSRSKLRVASVLQFFLGVVQTSRLLLERGG